MSAILWSDDRSIVSQVWHATNHFIHTTALTFSWHLLATGGSNHKRPRAAKAQSNDS